MAELKGEGEKHSLNYGKVHNFEIGELCSHLSEPYTDCSIRLRNFGYGDPGPSPFDVDRCIFCGAALRSHVIDNYLSIAVKGHGYINMKVWAGHHELEIHSIYLKECPDPKCGWWVFEQDLEWGFGDAAKSYCHSGQFRLFEVDLFDAEIAELRREIALKPMLVFQTHYDTFERLMAACVRDKFAGSTVTHVGRSGDRGIDVFAVIGEKPCLIQVKRRTNEDVAEGPRVVRELNGVLLREGVCHGMVLTTAKRFTRSAQAETAIKMSTPDAFTVELVALDGVIDLIRETANVPPFHSWTAGEPWRQLFVQHETTRKRWDPERRRHPRFSKSV